MGDPMGSRHAGRADPGRPFRARPRLSQEGCGRAAFRARAASRRRRGVAGRVWPDRQGRVRAAAGLVARPRGGTAEGGVAVVYGVIAARAASIFSA